MKKIVKQKWLEALRSGKYRQTNGNLCVEGNKRKKYCCLGVLCDLHAKETGNIFEPIGDGESFAYLDENGQLPSEVMRWAGLKDDQGALKKPIEDEEGYHNSLIDLNDDAEYNFKQIAEVIEKQF